MPTMRKRRAEAEPSPSPPSSRQRREGSSEVSEEDIDASGNFEGDGASGSLDQMVKKLVRLALATEFTRQPLRRADITAKVLHPHGRSFKPVFLATQDKLRKVFGMTLTELPSREKITVAQKRAAQRANGNSQAASASSKSYILTSTLPSLLRTPVILAPPRNPNTAVEAGYVGLCSMVVSLIYISQGQRISENRLLRYLKACNADEYVLDDKADNILKRMERQGYIVKVRDREPGGEEIIDWVVGPRGKTEIGEKGVAGLVKSVYGKRDVEMEELEDKLEKSLGKGTFKRKSRRRGEGGEEDEEKGEPNIEAHDEDEEAQTTAARRETRHGGGRSRQEETPARRRISRRSSNLIDDVAEDEDGEEEDDEDDDQEEESEEDEE